MSQFRGLGTRLAYRHTWSRMEIEHRRFISSHFYCCKFVDTMEYGSISDPSIEVHTHTAKGR